jgi:hypothetical protein
LDGFASEDRELFGSIGVLERWQKQKPEFQLELVLSLLHYSSRLLHEGKTLRAPSGGGSKPGPWGSDFLLDCRGFTGKSVAKVEDGQNSASQSAWYKALSARLLLQQSGQG